MKQDAVQRNRGVAETWGGSWGCSHQATVTDRRNGRSASLWQSVWMAVFLVAFAFIERRDGASFPVVLAGLAATALLAVPAVRAYARFLRQADELTRQIQLQAMAVGFGTGVVASFLEPFVGALLGFLSEAPQFVDVLHFVNPVLVMIVGFGATVRLLQRRYSR